MSNDIELPDPSLDALMDLVYDYADASQEYTQACGLDIPDETKKASARCRETEKALRAAILADRAKRAQVVQSSGQIYDAIKRVLECHRLTHTAEDEDSGFPLVDMLCPPDSRDIALGKDEIVHICDAIYNQVLAAAPAATESKPVQAEAPSDEQLREAFTKDTGGPNPFYRCKLCGETEPGLQEYLVSHWRKHRATPPAPCGAVEREALISKLCNVRAMAAERLPKVDVETIDEAIGALATSPTASGVGERDSYEAIWNALHEIDSAAVFLPTFKVNHEGGLEAFTKNIVEAIQAAAIATQPLEQKPGCPKCKRTDGQVCDWCPSLQPEQVEQKPVARVVRHEATVRLEWASVEAAHNAKPGPLYSAPQPEQVAQDADWFSHWIQNNYQDHPTISGLCDAMIEAAHSRGQS